MPVFFENGLILRQNMVRYIEHGILSRKLINNMLYNVYNVKLLSLKKTNEFA